MKEIWLPMDGGVIIVDRDTEGKLTVTDQVAMEKRPLAVGTGFAYKPRPPKRPPKK